MCLQTHREWQNMQLCYFLLLALSFPLSDVSADTPRVAKHATMGVEGVEGGNPPFYSPKSGDTRGWRVGISPFTTRKVVTPSRLSFHAGADFATHPARVCGLSAPTGAQIWHPREGSKICAIRKWCRDDFSCCASFPTLRALASTHAGKRETPRQQEKIA